MAEIRIHNLDIVLGKLKVIGGGAPQYVSEVVDRAIRQDLLPKWLDHTTLTDHSLEDLANLGHPYSTKSGVDSFVHPDSFVHEQSGSLAQGTSASVENQGSRIVGKLTNTSPNYEWVGPKQRGRMRLRDPGGAALAAASESIIRRLHTEIRNAILTIWRG